MGDGGERLRPVRPVGGPIAELLLGAGSDVKLPGSLGTGGTGRIQSGELLPAFTCHRALHTGGY